MTLSNSNRPCKWTTNWIKSATVCPFSAAAGAAQYIFVVVYPTKNSDLVWHHIANKFRLKITYPKVHNLVYFSESETQKIVN